MSFIVYNYIFLFFLYVVLKYGAVELENTNQSNERELLKMPFLKF